MKQVDMYVNGHALTNPGAAGGGVVLYCDGYVRNEMVSIGEATNNQAELEAAIFGMSVLTQRCEVTIYTCSQWLAKCGNYEWGRSSNTDKWEVFDKVAYGHDVTFQWIRKGTNDHLNTACEYANEAANKSALELEG